jgi:hypothetical protein
MGNYAGKLLTVHLAKKKMCEKTFSRLNIDECPVGHGVE